MNTVPHAVGSKRLKDRFFNCLACRDICERHGVRGIYEPVEMCIQRKNFSVIDTQTFPYAVSALDETIEYGNFRVFAG